MSRTASGGTDPTRALAMSSSAVSTTESDSSAQQIVKKHMLLALAVGLLPLPLIDVAALTAIQLRMLSKLSSLYNVDFSDQLGKSVIGSLVGSGGSVVASTTTTRLVMHLIPGGWVAGMVSTAAFAGASTYAVGKVFTEHFASGGTFLTFDPEKVRKYYEQQFAQGAIKVEKSFAGFKP